MNRKEINRDGNSSDLAKLELDLSKYSPEPVSTRPGASFTLKNLTRLLVHLNQNSTQSNPISVDPPLPGVAIGY